MSKLENYKKTSYNSGSNQALQVHIWQMVLLVKNDLYWVLGSGENSLKLSMFTAANLRIQSC